ncbi:hypothetical protein AJ88_41020 [Mesorhizobium amorphae CCBAU 01583]|nr:hypothetical protein AJ88_41020 [Mesorhizobium amorphae CCBAU 01583]
MSDAISARRSSHSCFWISSCICSDACCSVSCERSALTVERFILSFSLSFMRADSRSSAICFSAMASLSSVLSLATSPAASPFSVAASSSRDWRPWISARRPLISAWARSCSACLSASTRRAASVISDSFACAISSPVCSRISSFSLLTSAATRSAIRAASLRCVVNSSSSLWRASASRFCALSRSIDRLTCFSRKVLISRERRLASTVLSESDLTASPNSASRLALALAASTSSSLAAARAVRSDSRSWTRLVSRCCSTSTRFRARAAS